MMWSMNWFVDVFVNMMSEAVFVTLDWGDGYFGNVVQCLNFELAVSDLLSFWLSVA